MIEALTVMGGMLAGATAAIVASCIWGVLLIPARIQDRFQAASPRILTWAICIGMMGITCHDFLGFSLPLPPVFGVMGIFLGGMFVGMLASALEEILEVAPVLMRRFRLGDVSAGVRFVMMVGKGLGAVLAALVITS
ncbi:MAG: stage V sporulation protein AB [Aristaeellaceae bacterium]